MDYELLIKAGVDMDDFLRRLMGNTSLVKRFVTKFVADKTYQGLQLAVQTQDWKQAEVGSHTLKGMCGNMSLKELFALFTEQVNLLRSGEVQKAADLMQRIDPAYQETVRNMQLWLTQQ